MKCTDEKIGQLIALHEFGGLDDRHEKAVRDHLVICEYCYGQAYSLEPAMVAFRKHRAEAKSERRASEGTSQQTKRSAASLRRSDLWRIWHGIPAFGALCLLVIAVGGGVYLAAHRLKIDKTDPGSDGNLAGSYSFWRDLEVPKAAYSGPASGLLLRGPREAFQRAMSAYQANDFKAAVEQLETVSEMGPPNVAEVNFYLGVSLLMDGNAHESLKPLGRTVEQGDKVRREAAHYYLGLAYAKDRKGEQAILELSTTIELKGEHEAAARSLRDRIVEVTRSPQGES